MTPKKKTIHDIARLAGVSTATVSRVLNKKDDVKAETRERVMSVVEQEGFVSSLTAAGLAGRQSRLIGVLIPSLNWSFISEIIHGIAMVTEEMAHEIVLYTVPRYQDRQDVIERILATKLTSGLLAVQIGQSAKYLDDLYTLGFPVVMISDQVLPVEVSYPLIDADHRHGAYEAVSHLIQLGHRRIAHIHGPDSFLSSRERYAGYCDALQDAHIPLDTDLIVYGNFDIPSGRTCAEQLFALPERPTAIFCSNDDMSFGVLAVAEREGIRIPEDIALVSFDNIPMSAHMSPPLTTVNQPFFEMGAQATRLLLSMIETQTVSRKRRASVHVENMAQPNLIRLPTNLVKRESSGTVRYTTQNLSV